MPQRIAANFAVFVAIQAVASSILDLRQPDTGSCHQVEVYGPEALSTCTLAPSSAIFLTQVALWVGERDSVFGFGVRKGW